MCHILREVTSYYSDPEGNQMKEARQRVISARHGVNYSILVAYKQKKKQLRPR